MRASLIQLMCSGAIGGIGRGSQEGEVRERFGEPSATAERPRILKYDALEFTFVEGQVELIHVELREPLPTSVDSDRLSSETSVAEVERDLAGNGATWEPYPELTFEDDQTALRTVPGGAVAVFVDGKLSSISVS